MSDKRNGRQDVSDQGSGGQGQDSSRERLSRQALEQGTADSRDRVGRVADSRDRAAFRQQCGQELDSIRQDLKQASSDMADFNKAVKDGLRPGAPGYNEMFKKATDEYKSAVEHAKSDLYQVNRDGSVQIDPITGRPKGSDLLNRIKDERRMLGEEIDFLAQVKREGRQLTPTEMKKLNLDTPNVDEALMNRKQEDRAMKDLQRSVGYTEANYGLALIRSSVGSANPAAQMSEGRDKLQQAANDDPWMLGRPPAMPPDANYMKHYKEVMDIATNGGVTSYDARNFAGGSDISNMAGGAGGADQGRRLVDDNGRKVLADGPYRLPTGDVVPAAGFVSPYQMLDDAQRQLHNPLSQTDVTNFQKAIAQADSIDRVSLAKAMQEEQAYMDSVLADPQRGKAIRQKLAEMQANDKKMEKEQTALNSAIPALQQQGPDAAKMIDKLNSFNNVQELNNYIADPTNNDAINKFRSVPNGAQFISNMQQFMNDNAVAAELDKNLASIDPKFRDCQKAINEQQNLYHSSENARAHFLAVLDPTPGQPIADANVKQLAQQMVVELAKINPRLNQDAGFLQTAKDAGISPERMSATTTTGGGTLDRTALSSVSNAYAVLDQVKPGQALTADQVKTFQQSLVDAQRITPDMLTAQQRQLQADLAGKGWNDAKETQFQGIQKDIQASYKAMAPDSQHQLDQLVYQQQSATDAQQKAGFQNQIVELAKKDPAVAAWGGAQDRLAQMQAQDPNLFNERLKFEASQQRLNELAHAAPLITGLYGAALLKSGDQTNALPLLAQASRDPAVAQLAPEVGKLIQQTGADKIPVAPTFSDQSQPQPGSPAAGGSINDKAFAAIKEANAALAQVAPTADKQPLPAQLDAVFQNAINLSSQVNPQQLESLKAPLHNELFTPTNVQTQDGRTISLPAWTDQKEKDYTGLQMQFLDARSKISQPAQQTLASATSQQDSDAKLQQLASSDPTVKAFVDASQQLTAYRQQNPDTQKRDLYEQKMAQITQVQHGKAIAETLYAEALSRTGNAQDAQKAQAVMRDAMTDAQLAQVFPPSAAVAQKLGLIGDRSAAAGPQGQTAPSELDKIVPGYPDLRNALNTMNGTAGTLSDRLAKADPMFQRAIEASNHINIGQLDVDIAANNAKIKKADDAYKTLVSTSGENPAALAQAQQAIAPTLKEQAVLNELRLEPMQSRMLYAEALNRTAADLYAQGEKDKAHKDQLTKQGDELNAKATAALKSLDKVDPAAAQDPQVIGALQQIKERQLIEMHGALAIGKISGASNDLQPYSEYRAFAPEMLTGNLIGEAFKQAEPIPLIGPLAGALGSMAPSQKGNVLAAVKLSEARLADPKEAEKRFEEHRKAALSAGAHTVNDIVSGTAAVAIADRLAPKLAASIVERAGMEAGNPWIKGISIAAYAGTGLVASGGINRGLDYAENQTLHTNMLSTNEWMAHSIASFGAGVAIKGIAAQEAKFAGRGVPVARTTVEPTVAPEPAVPRSSILEPTAVPEHPVVPETPAPVVAAKSAGSPGAVTDAGAGHQAATTAGGTPVGGDAGTKAAAAGGTQAPVVGDAGTKAAAAGGPPAPVGGDAGTKTVAAGGTSTPGGDAGTKAGASGGTQPQTGDAGSKAAGSGANAQTDRSRSATSGSGDASSVVSAKKTEPFGGITPDAGVKEAYNTLSDPARAQVDAAFERAAKLRGGNLTPKQQMEAFGEGVDKAASEASPGRLSWKRYAPTWRGFNAEGATGIGKYNPLDNASARYAEKVGADPGSGFASYTYKMPQNLVQGMRGNYFNLEEGGTLAMNGERLGTTLADYNARRFLGHAGWRAAEGAAGMGILSFGSTNPFTAINPETGKNYTYEDTFKAAGIQALWGAGASAIAAPLVPKVAHMSAYVPIKLAKGIGWMAESEAGAVVAKPFQGMAFEGWKATTAAATATRAGVGFAGTGTLGTVLNSPIVNSKNTWGGALDAGWKWGAVGGLGAAGTPFALEYGTKALAYAGNKTVLPLYERVGTGVNFARAAIGRTTDRAWQAVAGEGTAGGALVNRGADIANRSRWLAPYGAGFAMGIGEGGGSLYEAHQWTKVHELSDQMLAQKAKDDAAAAAAAKKGTPQADAGGGQQTPGTDRSAQTPPKPANETGPVANPYNNG